VSEKLVAKGEAPDIKMDVEILMQEMCGADNEAGWRRTHPINVVVVV
jgi:hypothetical protein